MRRAAAASEPVLDPRILGPRIFGPHCPQSGPGPRIGAFGRLMVSALAPGPMIGNDPHHEHAEIP